MRPRSPAQLVPALLLTTGLLTGCGASDPAAQADAAQTALSTGDAAAARAKAEEGLKAAGAADKSLAWRLERIRVEAIAKQGNSAEVVGTMSRLAQAYPTQCDAPFYSKVANALAEGGEGVGALEVANAGLQRFPDRKADFDGLIEQLKQTAAAGDAELTAKLKSLGYL